jgi:hypothetical protein
MPTAAQHAIAAVQAGQPVVCTLADYYTTVRLALQRYAVVQAAHGYPQMVERVTSEIQRLDRAQAEGWWPGAYRAWWERLVVWCGGRYATRTLGRYYYRRAHSMASPSRQERVS